MRMLLWAFMLSFGFGAGILPALPTASIGYQGRLSIEDDPTHLERLEQPHELRFYLYRSERGGEPVWGRAVSVTPDEKGYFVTVLSDAEGTAVLDHAPALEAVLGAAATDEELWLTFAVGRDESREITPRQRLFPLKAAYAVNSAEKGSDGFTVTGTLKAYTFESSTVTFSAPMRCRTLSVTDAEKTLNVQGELTLNNGLSLLGGPLKSEEKITLGPKTTGGTFFPIGSIVMWSGAVADIPAGWALCDGANGTPDLRGRFLFGAATNLTLGSTGGSTSVTLTEAHIPKHAHSLTYDEAKEQNVELFWLSRSSENEDERTWRGEKTRSTTAAKRDGTTEAHSNLPQYYALCFIQRVE